MKKFKRVAKFGKTKIAAGLVLVTAGSSSAFAADMTTQIGAAQTEAMANQTLVITAVLGLAIVSFGVGMLVKWMSR